MILRYDLYKDTMLRYDYIKATMMILYSGPYNKISCSLPNSCNMCNTQIVYLLLCLVVIYCLYAQHMAAPYSSSRISARKVIFFPWASPFGHPCLVQGWTLIQAEPAQVACLLIHSQLAHVWESDWVWATKFFSPVFLIRIRKSQSLRSRALRPTTLGLLLPMLSSTLVHTERQEME